jgi:hypothetical protein
MYPYDWLIQKGGLYNFKHIFNIQLYIYSGGILSSRDYNYKKSIPYEAYWRIQALLLVFSNRPQSGLLSYSKKCYVKGDDEEWTCCTDEKVFTVRYEEIKEDVERKCYIIMYSRGA